VACGTVLQDGRAFCLVKPCNWKYGWTFHGQLVEGPNASGPVTFHMTRKNKWVRACTVQTPAYSLRLGTNQRILLSTTWGLKAFCASQNVIIEDPCGVQAAELRLNSCLHSTREFTWDGQTYEWKRSSKTFSKQMA